jgi:histidinol-phosphate phosphatase family protein
MAAARLQGKAVFLDRDGVINRLVYRSETGSTELPASEAEFEILPKVAEAIRDLNQLGLKVIVVSNQPGVAKGVLSRRELRAMDDKFKAYLAVAEARIDAIYYCLHHPQGTVRSLRKRCSCRKPGIGLLRAAAKRFGLSVCNSYMVGDSVVDLAAGRRAGCTTVFIGRWKCELCQLKQNACHPPDLVAKDLWSAVQIIKQDLSTARIGSVCQCKQSTVRGRERMTSRRPDGGAM